MKETKCLQELDLDGRAFIGFIKLRTACCVHGHESAATIKQMGRIFWQNGAIILSGRTLINEVC